MSGKAYFRTDFFVSAFFHYLTLMIHKSNYKETAGRFSQIWEKLFLLEIHLIFSQTLVFVIYELSRLII